MKIIVTGCRGQLGTEILKQLREGRSEIGPIPEKLLNATVLPVDLPELDISNYRMVEKRQGIKISAPEEIAFKYGWIDRETLLTSAERYGKSPYGQHLKNVADGKLRY